jgi:hypothetical protein
LGREQVVFRFVGNQSRSNSERNRDAEKEQADDEPGDKELAFHAVRYTGRIASSV